MNNRLIVQVEHKAWVKLPLTSGGILDPHRPPGGLSEKKQLSLLGFNQLFLVELDEQHDEAPPGAIVDRTVSPEPAQKVVLLASLGREGRSAGICVSDTQTLRPPLETSTYRQRA